MRTAQQSGLNLQKPSELTEVFKVTRLFTFASHKNVTISVWRDTPTAEALKSVHPFVATVARNYPKIASVVVMESLDFRAPEQAARVEHGRLTKEYESVTLGVALIVDGNSAKHSVYRFVLSTMTLLSSPIVTQKIFPAAGSAATWLRGCDLSLNRDELVRAIEEARALKNPHERTG